MKRKVQSSATSRIQASEDEIGVAEFTQNVPNPDDNATFGPDEFGGADEVSANDADNGPQATTHFPNGEQDGSDEEATRGYLTVGDLTDLGPDSDTVGEGFGGGEDEEGDEEFEDDNEEVNAAFGEEPDTEGADLNEGNEAHQQSLLDVTDEHEVDAEFDDFTAPEGEPTEVEDEALSQEANVDEMDLMDVDGMDDDFDTGGMTTAAMGTMLHVIKANRIVASMNKKVAVRAGHSDMYLSDEFHEATMAECQAMGVRAGLKAMGFVLAKVNVAKSDTLNKRVNAKAKQVTASIQRQAKASNDALGQCLAIAAVGINRQYFRDTRNELRAALEVELGAAGVRGASKLVRRVFASHGVDYAKAILTLANRLVGMPEEARNQFASALDMTSEGDFDTDSGLEASDDGDGADMDGADDSFGMESEPDFQVESDFEDDFEAEEPAPETIHAALASPAFRKQSQRVQASAANYSVHAAAILNGTAAFGFNV